MSCVIFGQAQARSQNMCFSRLPVTVFFAWMQWSTCQGNMGMQLFFIIVMFSIFAAVLTFNLYGIYIHNYIRTP